MRLPPSPPLQGFVLLPTHARRRPTYGTDELTALLDDSSSLQPRLLEILAIGSSCAAKTEPKVRKHEGLRRCKEGDQVLVAKRMALGPLKILAFASKRLGPYKVTDASHPRFRLRTDDGTSSRKPIRACRLPRYFFREEATSGSPQ